MLNLNIILLKKAIHPGLILRISSFLRFLAASRYRWTILLFEVFFWRRWTLCGYEFIRSEGIIIETWRWRLRPLVSVPLTGIILVVVVVSDKGTCRFLVGWRGLLIWILGIGRSGIINIVGSTRLTNVWNINNGWRILQNLGLKLLMSSSWIRFPYWNLLIVSTIAIIIFHAIFFVSYSMMIALSCCGLT